MCGPVARIPSGSGFGAGLVVLTTLYMMSVASSQIVFYMECVVYSIIMFLTFYVSPIDLFSMICSSWVTVALYFFFCCYCSVKSWQSRSVDILFEGYRYKRCIKFFLFLPLTFIYAPVFAYAFGFAPMMVFQCDKEYARSKRDRKEMKEARKKNRNAINNAISERDRVIKRRAHLKEILAKEKSRLVLLQDEYGSKFSRAMDQKKICENVFPDWLDKFQEDVLKKFESIKIRVDKKATHIAKLIDEIDHASTVAEARNDYIMQYNSKVESFYTDLLTALQGFKMDGDKVAICLGVYAEVKNFMRCKTVTDYVDLSIGILSRFLKPSIISSNLGVLEKTLREHFLPSEMEKEGLTETFHTVKDVMNKPLTGLIKKVIALCVVIPMAIGLIDKENLPDFVNFALEIPKKVEGTEFMSYLLKLVSYIANCIPFYNRSVSWSDLIDGNTVQQIVANELAEMKYQYDLMKNGNPLRHNKDHPQLPLIVFFGRLKVLRTRISGELKFKSGGELVSMRREFERVTMWMKHVEEKMQATNLVPAPVVFSFLSSPGVGKTTLQKFVMTLAMKNCGFPCDSSQIGTVNPEDKFDSHGEKLGIIIDDYKQTQKDKEARNETLLVIRMANNVKMYGNSADLESKGRQVLNPVVLSITGNGPFWRAHEDIVETAAFFRRININFDKIVPKPEYCLPNSNQLDSSKAYDETNAWNFRMSFWRVTPEPNAKGFSNVVQYFYKSDFSLTTNEAEAGIFDLVKASELVIAVSQKHFFQQDKMLESVDKIGTEWCEHVIDGKAVSYLKKACAICDKAPVPLPTLLNVSANGNMVLTTIPPVEPTNTLLAEATATVNQLVEMENEGLITFSVGVIWFSGFLSWLKTFLPAKVKYLLYVAIKGWIVSFWVCFLYGFVTTLYSYNKGWLSMKIGSGVIRIVDLLATNGVAAAKQKIKFFIIENKYKILIMLAVATLMMTYRMTTQGNVEFGNKPDTWGPHINKDIVLNDARTTSTEDVINVLKRNIVSVRVNNAAHSTSGNAIPYRGFFYLMNAHYLDCTPQSVDITRYNHLAPQSRYHQPLHPDFYQLIPDTDIAVVWMPKTMRNSDFSKFFVSKMPNLAVDCLRIYKDKTGAVEELAVRACPEPCRVKDILVDEAFTYEGKNFLGLCGAPLISCSKRPVVLGMHWAGDKEKLGRCSASFLCKDKIEKAIGVIKSKVSVYEESVPQNLQVQGLVEGSELTGKNSFNHLDQQGSLTFLGMSSHPREKPTSNVVNTCLYDELSYANDYTFMGPTIGEHWRPIFTAQSTMSLHCFINIPWHYLKMALEDFKLKVLGCASSMEDIKTLKPLTFQEAMDGTNRPGEEKMKLNTSVGNSYLRYGGKKTMFFSKDENGSIIPPDGFEEKINEIEEAYLNGETRGMCFSQKVKNEVLSKPKARVFSSNPVEYLVLVRKYFLPLCGLYRRHNSTFENAVGANVYGPDWQDIVGEVTKFGPDRMHYGDYKNYDQSVTAEEILTAFKFLIWLAALSGNYSQRDLRIMWGIAHDLANPLYFGNGAFYFASGTVSSGTSLTTILNGIVNSLRHRSVYYANNLHVSVPSAGSKDLFHFNVSLIVLGDDCAGSVKEGINFGMLVMSEQLGKWGITYTNALKSDVLYELGSLKDFTFLKRGAIKIEGIDQYVAPLAVQSIYKPLMTQVPSDVLSPDQQLAEAVDGSCREAFFHGRDFYECFIWEMEEICSDKPFFRYVQQRCFMPYERRLEEWRENYYADKFTVIESEMIYYGGASDSESESTL